MCRNILILMIVGLAFSSVWGQPREWKDDFTVARTYDSASFMAPCPPPYGSNGPSTKYTLLEAISGDIYNDRAVSGVGRLLLSSRLEENGVTGPRWIVAAVGVLDLGQPCPDNPDPTPGASQISSEAFSSPDVCMYGGFRFTHWHLRYEMGNFDGRKGADNGCGIAGVDDDLDGTTDEDNECLARRPTTVSNRYGSAGSNAYKAGVDTCPGTCGVDEDGNGVVDDYGEIGWPGTDDGDDLQRIWYNIGLKGDFSATSIIYLNIDPAAGGDGSNNFSIRDILNGSEDIVAASNEIVNGFYRPQVQYNYVFCHSGGTCFGAILWTGTDMANPDETVGPVMNSDHTTPKANVAGVLGNTGEPLFIRQYDNRGNSNFGDTFWIVSGPSSSFYPSPSADLDADKDVDGFDFLTFSNCYNGSNKAPLAACANTRADLDKDGDVDGFDFLTFSNCYNGSNRKPLAACFPPNLTSCGS